MGQVREQRKSKENMENILKQRGHNKYNHKFLPTQIVAAKENTRVLEAVIYENQNKCEYVQAARTGASK
jgi:hypothetical protein